MITVIHGDDTTSSRDYFYSEKAKFNNPIIFDNNNFNLTDFLQSLSGKSLFNVEKNIFLDGIFSSKKASTDQIDSIISEINKPRSPIDFFVWEGSGLSKTFLNQFPKATIKFFKLPQSVFSFLDGIRPNNPQNISLFHNALKNSDEGFLFSMLTRQFRLLMDSNENGGSIEETKRLQPWQKEKLQRQSKMFTTEQLKKAYHKLYETDLGIKTGVYQNLTTAINFFLLEI